LGLQSITDVSNPVHLVASHCGAGVDSVNNEERLSAENGLLLTPSIDHLFDRGFIGFEKQRESDSVARGSPAVTGANGRENDGDRQRRVIHDRPKTLSLI
jgi:hypothetical protein